MTGQSRFPWGSGPAPALDCSVCGHRMGKRRGHFIFEHNRLICGRCADWPNGSSVAAHARHYPDCPKKWHDMWDHLDCMATRAAAWYVLSRASATELQELASRGRC
jgi:hypothetical protein